MNVLGVALCVNGYESEYPFSVSAYESKYSKIDEYPESFKNPEKSPLAAAAASEPEANERGSFLISRGLH